MPQADAPGQRRLAAIVALVAMAALVLQYALLLGQLAPTIGAGLATLRFASYFTILSNLLVAAVCIVAVARRGGGLASPTVRGGAALYIGITGLVYVAILRHLWHSAGAQWWADCALHYAVPALYLACWAGCAPHGALGWRELPRWLLFPLAYLAWVGIRARWIEPWVPYPFLDIAALGAQPVLRNILLVLVAFVFFGGVIVAVDRRLGRARKTG